MTSVAIFSVVRGIDGGIKLLSNINMVLAACLLLFVLILGQGHSIFISLADTTGAYLVNLLPLSNSFGREDDTWFHGWTVFYWAWWISWSPFVGMFIARITKGHTVRQFVIAVLLVPTLVTVIWMTAFGGTGLDQAINGTGQLAKGAIPFSGHNFVRFLC